MERRRPLSPKQARVLTDRIVDTPKERWTRIAEAHARGVSTALGYATWADYCESEFGPERFRIPRRHRIRVLTELKDAGMSFEDVEVVVIPRTGHVAAGPTAPTAPPEPAALPLPGDWGPEEPTSGRRSTDEPPGTPRNGAARRKGRIEDQLGFSAEELALIGALIEVDDEEFERVLRNGHRRGDLTPTFVRDQIQVVVRTRDTLERSLDRALRAVERAREMLDRGNQAPLDVNPAILDLIKLLEDEAWDLVDTVDRMHVRLDNDRARNQPG